MTPEENKACERLALEAWRHLKKTNRRSVDESGKCVYTGSGCAFSPAIKPEHIADAGRNSARDLIERNASWLHEWARKLDPDFSMHVQGAHDTCYQGSIVDIAGVAEHENFVWEFYKKLKMACKKHEVKVPSYDKFSQQ